jgi:mannose-6-phosphate isomerase-like protein (cupin superfamily)
MFSLESEIKGGDQMKKIMADEARLFMEGPEICREYFKTARILFGSSTLSPGETGEVDFGHPLSEEVFYVCEGSITIADPSSGNSVDLQKGDAVLISPSVQHQITNTGKNIAIVTWSCAPCP